MTALPDPVDAGDAEFALNMVSGAELEQAVATLSEGYREVLLLHDVEGHTHDEIGTLLGISSGTSKSQLHRARKRLRQVFEQGDMAHG